MILTFASSKGGVGKSTTCACIASALAGEGARVAIIDLDQSRTLDRWARHHPLPGLTVEALAPEKFTDRLRECEASGAFDHICIDLAGTREVTLFKVLARSDLVIIPAQASAPDLHEALRVVADIRDVGETARRLIPYRLLLTKVGSLRTRVLDHVCSELARKGLPMFRTVLGERTAYREMFLNGLPPTHTDKGGREGAGQEILSLLAEIRAITGMAETLKQAG